MVIGATFCVRLLTVSSVCRMLHRVAVMGLPVADFESALSKFVRCTFQFAPAALGLSQLEVD